MQTLTPYLQKQIEGAAVQLHKWRIFVEITPAPAYWIELDSQKLSLSRVGWELEKDWSVFIAGDVSFSVEDIDGAIRNLIGTGSNRVKIYANYSDYSHNEDCPVFCGYIKPKETRVEKEIVTYYAQSIYPEINNYVFYGRTYVTEDDYFTGVVPLRTVLQDDWDLRTAARLNFDDVQLTGFDRAKGNFYKITANPRHFFNKDCILESEDLTKYTLLSVARIGIRTINIRRVYIYKDDPSKVIEDSEVLTTITATSINFDMHSDPFKIFKSSSTAYKFVIIVKNTAGNMAGIIKINNNFTFNVRCWINLPSGLEGEVAQWSTASMSEDGELLCIVAGGNKLTRFDITGFDFISQWYGLPNVVVGGMKSATLTNYESEYLYGVVMISAHSFPYRLLNIFKFTKTATISFDNLFRSQPVGMSDFVYATGRFFFVGGVASYYNAVINAWAPIPDISGIANIKFAENYFIGGFKSVYMLDSVATKIRISRQSGNSLIQVAGWSYDIIGLGTDYISSVFNKVKTLKEDIVSDLIIPIEAAYVLQTKRCPMLIDFTAFPSAGTTIKEALQQMFGSYFLALYIPDWIVLMIGLTPYTYKGAVSRPRAPATFYTIPGDSIMMDTIKIDSQPKYKIRVTSQGQFWTAEDEGELLEFNYDCLPPIFLPDITNFIRNQFLGRIKISFVGDSLFYVELTDGVEITDELNNITYQGIVTKNEIGVDGLCNIQMFGKAV